MLQSIAAPAFRLVAEIDDIQRGFVRFLHFADVFLKKSHAGRTMAHDVHRGQVSRGGSITKHRIKPGHLAGRPGEQHLAPRLEQATHLAIHEPDIGLHILGAAQFCQVSLVVNNDVPKTGRGNLGDTDHSPAVIQDAFRQDGEDSAARRPQTNRLVLRICSHSFRRNVRDIRVFDRRTPWASSFASSALHAFFRIDDGAIEALGIQLHGNRATGADIGTSRTRGTILDGDIHATPS